MPVYDLQILPENIRSRGVVKNYPKDTILHYQEDVHHHICFLQSGRAFATSINIEGDETWVAEYTVGQFLGCEGLFDREPSKYQVVAKTPITGILFSRENFIDLLNAYPELNNMLLADMARQLNRATTHTLEANSLSTPGRIAAELYRQARPIGRDPGTHIIRPTPVFSELAQRLGSSRETVSRTVSKMVKTGVLERKTGALVVPSLEYLHAQIE